MTELHSVRDISTLGLSKNEQELVEIFYNYDEQYWNRIVHERKSAFLAQELFSERENSVRWLDIKQTDRVLEIGSGYGALTGALADQAGSVVSYDISEVCCAINGVRQRSRNNIAIYSGDFDAIRTIASDKKFNLITLIGDDTDLAKLDEYQDLLTFDGRLILGLSNRYGMKYWAGCPTSKYDKQFYFPAAINFAGSSAFGATRAEIERAAHAAGFNFVRFYYPYPDQYFVRSIYSDDFLPSRGDLTLNSFSWVNERLRIFAESDLYDQLLLDGLYPLFTNAFFVILERSKMSKDRMLHTQFSSARDRRFQTRTEIGCSADGKRFVRKIPLSKVSKTHVENTCKNSSLLKYALNEKGVQVAVGKWRDGEAEFPYLDGESLAKRMAGKANADAIADFRQDFESYCDLVRSMAMCPFQQTDRFREVFGDVDLPSGLFSCDLIDVDFIPQNILIVCEKLQMIDTEWTFDFPIPIDFILYRAIFYFQLDYPAAAKKLSEIGVDLWRVAGIDNLRRPFAAMEYNFQNNYVGIRCQNFSTLDFSRNLVPTLERCSILKRSRNAICAILRRFMQ